MIHNLKREDFGYFYPSSDLILHLDQVELILKDYEKKISPKDLLVVSGKICGKRGKFIYQDKWVVIKCKDKEVWVRFIERNIQADFEDLKLNPEDDWKYYYSDSNQWKVYFVNDPPEELRKR